MFWQESPNYSNSCSSDVRLQTGKRNRKLFLCSLKNNILIDPNLFKFWNPQLVLQVASCNFHQQVLRSFSSIDVLLANFITFFNEERPFFYRTKNCRRFFSQKNPFLRRPRDFWILFVWKRPLETRLSKMLGGNLIVVY